MLINLSNHPSEAWQEKQLQDAVSSFGIIEDISFPNIDPSSSNMEIMEMARAYCKTIIDKKPDAVHIMGEMTFTFALINLLQQKGILCLASTSERRVTTGEKGLKTVRFDFVQFRAYTRISNFE